MPAKSPDSAYDLALKRVKAPSFIVASAGGNMMDPDHNPRSIIGDVARGQILNVIRSVQGIARDAKGALFTHGNGKIVKLCELALEMKGRRVSTASKIRYSQEIVGVPMVQGSRKFFDKQGMVNHTRVVVEPRKVGELPEKEVDAWINRDLLFSHATESVEPVNNEVVKIDGVYYAVSADNTKLRKLVWAPSLVDRSPIYEPDLQEILDFVQGGVIPIAVGGGGVPVFRDGKGQITEVEEEAVVDKDEATVRLVMEMMKLSQSIPELAELFNKLVLLIVTGSYGMVDGFGTDRAKTVQQMSYKEVPIFLDSQNNLGGMKPKAIQSACLTGETGVPVVIAHRDDLENMARGDFSRATVIHDGDVAVI